MAESSSTVTAGVVALETDKSSPTPQVTTGIPAGIIGTAQQGPAFVPVTVANFSQFENQFGTINGDQFGPIAAKTWLDASAARGTPLTYVRVLGTGDGKKRSTSTGKVTNAGFVVGQQLPLDTGFLGNNPFANAVSNAGNGPAPLGRTYFLGCYMSQSADSEIFTHAKIPQNFNGNSSPAYTGSVPIIRGILMAASGVALNLSSSNSPSDRRGNQALSGDASSDMNITIQQNMTGAVNLSEGNSTFNFQVFGLKNKDASILNITASFDPNDSNYISNVLNKDPEKFQELGHLLYAHYDIHPSLATITGTSITTIYDRYKAQEVAFLLTGSRDRDTGANDAPNYESFEDRFVAARTPFITSQKFGGSSKDLFRVHMLSDGVVRGKVKDDFASNTKYKVSIRDITKGTTADPYGTFTLELRDYYDTDTNKNAVETYAGLNLNPNSTRYIARVIGDMNTFFDFDRNEGSQRLVVKGKYPNLSGRIRVEMNSVVDDGEIESSAVPMGFRGLDHIITSGSNAIASSGSADARTRKDDVGNYGVRLKSLFQSIMQPPVPFRENLRMAELTSITPTVERELYFGVQFETKTSAREPNSSNSPSSLVANFTKYFPDFGVSDLNFITGSNAGQADENGYVLDCDVFNNNGFSLENLQVKTGSGGVLTDTESLFKSCSYNRTGVPAAVETPTFTRGLTVDDLDGSNAAVINLAKFTLPFQQGFNGVNVYDKNTSDLENSAIVGEMADVSRGETSGPTTAAYRKAADIMGEKADVDIQILAIPGIRHSAVTDEAISVAEDRFDTLYVMDIEERDALNTVVTSSVQNVHVKNTATAFADRALDSSFAAAYFPDLIKQVSIKTLRPESGNEEIDVVEKRVPPSIGVLNAIAVNDSVKFPWFAPAGETRGVTGATSSTMRQLNAANLDALNARKINPIVSKPTGDATSGPIVMGQRTLQVAATALDRVNVRRLLIDVRRSIKQVAQGLIFEPNREATLQRFTALVTPILERVQQTEGIARFRVVIDSTTTTQTDIENNTVRGKIFLQPNRSAEFITLDFTVSNAGVEGL
tara:strand:+ start:3037 stop:6201 length:3165 start_codon:yes stop_codon:yes gene_type:complete